MKGIFSLIRPVNFLFIVFASMVVFIVSGGILEFDEKTGFVLFQFIGLAFIATGGYIFNDIRDIETDTLNHRKRPLAQGIISIKKAKVYFLVLTLLGSSLFFYPFIFIHKFYLLLVPIVNVLVLLLYSIKFKGKPLIGNVIVAALLCQPIWLGHVLAINSFDFTLDIAFLTLFCFVSNLLREVLKDLEDIKGDKIIGLETLPIIIGVRNTRKIGVYLIIIEVLLLFINQAFFPDSFIFGLSDYALVPVAIVLLTSIIMVYYYLSLKKYRYSAHWVKIHLLLGVISYGLKYFL
jgi:4-hydroxybenzoate polyprenyltransferase